MKLTILQNRQDEHDIITTTNLGFKDETNLSENVHISSPKLITMKNFRHPFCCQSLVAKESQRRKNNFVIENDKFVTNFFVSNTLCWEHTCK